MQPVATPAGTATDTGTVAGRPVPSPDTPPPARPVPQASQQQGSDASRAAVEKAVAAAREKVKLTSSNLQFSIDEQSGKTIVRVVDAGTNELIRQIPAEEMLAIARNLSRLEGALLDKKA
jgi:flagellar protein FlaG